MSNGEVKNQNPIALAMAALVLIAFAVVLGYMIHIASGADDKLWTRSTYLFGSIEAIAFAAAGFIFGKEVHRQQAANAERRADAADQKASAASQKAAEATKAASSIKSLVDTKAAAKALLTGANPQSSAGISDLQEISAFSERVLKSI